MSIKSIKSQIDYFLALSNPFVMAIKGDWGIGKTFSWNKYLAEARKEDRISGVKYSYVSLFGIKSIEQLKEAIFSNAVSNNHAGEQPSLQTFQNNAKNLVESFSKNSWKFMKDVPYLNYAKPAVDAWSFMSISRYLICIDDLERKGTTLEIKEVLGLVSLLKEQKDCKVVLLLNDGTNEVEDYKKYKEKVIDLELHFSPSPKESAEIAYDNSKEYHSRLAEYTIKLGINNIRILKKIETTIDYLWLRLDKCEEDLKKQLLHTSALMVWSFLNPNSGADVPRFEFIQSMSNIHSIGGKDASEEERAWKEILLSYEFTMNDEFDNLIAKLIKHGYFDVEHVTSVIESANNNVIQGKKANGMKNAWDIFHNSFKHNEAEVIEAFIKAVKDTVHSVTVNQLDNIIGVIRDLGESDKASELIDFFIEKRRGTPIIFNIHGFDIYNPIKDEEIIQRFDYLHQECKGREDFKEVLARLDGSNGWNPEDLDVLDKVTEDEYYSFFKSLDGPELTSTIATTLKFARISNADEQMNSITTKVKSALHKIAEESTLNKIRMSKFNL